MNTENKNLPYCTITEEMVCPNRSIKAYTGSQGGAALWGISSKHMYQEQSTERLHAETLSLCDSFIIILL